MFNCSFWTLVPIVIRVEVTVHTTSTNQRSLTLFQTQFREEVSAVYVRGGIICCSGGAVGESPGYAFRVDAPSLL